MKRFEFIRHEFTPLENGQGYVHEEVEKFLNSLPLNQRVVHMKIIEGKMGTDPSRDIPYTLDLYVENMQVISIPQVQVKS